MREKEFQQRVVEEAHVAGWMTYHTYDSRRSTPGFPDLVMVRADRLIFAELKVRGKPRPEQDIWLDALRETGAEVYLWYPKDTEEILAILDSAYTSE